MAKKRLTIEEVQSRIDERGLNMTVIEWNGTTKPCKVKCNECGIIVTFKNGVSVWQVKTKYGGNDGCLLCKAIDEKKDDKEYLHDYLYSKKNANEYILYKIKEKDEENLSYKEKMDIISLENRIEAYNCLIKKYL